MKFLVKVTRKHYTMPFFPCPLLFCIVFSWLGVGGVQEASNSLQQSLDTFCWVFKVPCRSSPPYYSIHLHSTITKLHSSSCSVAVVSLCLFTCLFIPVSSRSVPQALLSFYCRLSFVLKPSFCLLLSTGISHRSSSHKFNFCCYASSLPFCNHTSRMRNEVQVR